jgi:nuclear GTP-binding protein
LVDTNVKLIDSPGVVLKDETNASAVGQILLNAKEIGSVEDARQAAYEIIARCDDMEKMAFHYQLEISDKIINNNPDNFLAALAIRKGALKKGGKPDINRACRFLVREWTIGNLSFHTMPPVAEGKIADSIQTEMSEELDLDAMFIGKDVAEMDDGSKQAGMTVLFKNSGTEGTSIVKIEKARKVKKRKSDYEDEEDDDMEDDEVPKDLKHLELPEDHGKDLSNASSGKDMQKLQKKRRKQLKKSRTVANEVADKMLEEMNFEDM